MNQQSSEELLFSDFVCGKKTALKTKVREQNRLREILQHDCM